ncbi:MAG: redoxin family protein, partial [Burkholderiales bacterium]
MTIKVGERLPAGVLWEFIEEERPGCSLGPNEFKVQDMVKGKRIAIFGLPGAFTPTCSAKHLPGYVQKADQVRKNVDEIWCLSVNDAFVMGAWGKQQGAQNKVRMMADG